MNAQVLLRTCLRPAEAERARLRAEYDAACKDLILGEPVKRTPAELEDEIRKVHQRVVGLTVLIARRGKRRTP